MSELKTTEYDTHSDVQEEVVAPPTEIRNGEYADDGQESFVDSQTPYENDEADVGEDAGVPDSDGAGQNSPTQTREENSAIRAARLRAAREAERAAAAKADREIASSGVINPLTNKPFKSMAEFREYGEKFRKSQLEERARAQGRSFEEVEEEELNRKYVSDMRRRDTENNPKTENEFLKNDVLDFIEKYPEFASPEKLEKLETNSAFRKFCGSRFGKEPLSELFEAYQELTHSAETSALAKNASRNERSTGGGNVGGAVLTPAQRKTLDEWNAANPEMQMTPREFLSR